MTWTFNHHLHVVLPRSVRKFSETHELFNLANVCRVCQASRSARVSERHCNVVFLADIKNLVVIFVERIFVSCHHHPCKDERASAAYDVHLPPDLPNLLDCLSRYSAVQCHKINSVLCVETDDIDEIFRCERCKVALVVDYAVVHRHRSNHRRAFARELLPERLRVSVARQIHYRLRAHLNRAHHFLHLDVVILAVPRNSQVHVDFRPEHRSDSLRIERFVVLVARNRDFPFRHKIHQDFLVHEFLFRYDFHLVRDDSLSRRIHLRRVIPFVHFIAPVF